MKLNKELEKAGEAVRIARTRVTAAGVGGYGSTAVRLDLRAAQLDLLILMLAPLVVSEELKDG